MPHTDAPHRAMLQEALGLATALNRTLIIPEFTCYCDQDYYTTVLGNCTVLGTDMHIPYACPVDLFLVPDFLEVCLLLQYVWT